MNLHIGIDGNEANVAHRVGSNWYAYEILKAIYSLTRSPETRKPLTRFTVYLKDPPVADMPAATAWWRYRVLTPRKAWTQWRLPLDLYLHLPRPQVFYCPGHYAPRFSPVPTVVTVLDLAFLEYPNLFLKYERGYLQLKTWTEYSVRHAARLLTISQSSQRDIVRHYRYPAAKITVAYPGINTVRFNREPEAVVRPVLTKYGVRPPYFLYVGTIQPRKNLVRLIEAFTQLPARFHDYQLVIAGGSGWLMEEFNRKVAASPAKDRIRQTGYVPDADLPALYSGASALVFIGLHEGFGIPAAEALACGTLPVVAATASLPEVVGPGGLVVDPFSLTEIKHGIIMAADMPAKARRDRLRLGQEHIRQFTWDRSARTVLEVLYDVALHRPQR